MELDQLRHFLRLAELSNFTKAAEANQLSQSALSRSIGRLEQELGQPLFERQSRKAVLTEAGHRLFERAKQILALIDNAKAEICDDGQTGHLRIGAIPTIAPYLLPKLLQRFQRDHPKATLLVQEDTTDHLMKRLSNGEVDVAFAALPIEVRYLHVEKLFDEELLLVLPNNHPLSKKNVIRIADLQSLPFILLSEAHCLTEELLSFCRQKSFHPLSVERTSQLAMVQELVALNHGISFIPAMAKECDRTDRCVYRSMSGAKPKRSVVLVTNPYRYQSQLQKKFESLVREQLQSQS